MLVLLLAIAFPARGQEVVARSQLTVADGVARLEETPFTGYAIQYNGRNVLLAFAEGREVALPDPPPAMPDTQVHSNAYRRAFRHYVELPDTKLNHDDLLRMLRDRLWRPEDVPKLLETLRAWQDVEPSLPVICTRAHCLDILRKITGASPGNRAEQWEEWLEKNPLPGQPRPRRPARGPPPLQEF